MLMPGVGGFGIIGKRKPESTSDQLRQSTLCICVL